MATKNPVIDEPSEEEAKETKTDPLHEIRERYKVAASYWDDDRKQALDDIKFRAGDQWPDDVKTQRDKDQRPCLIVDKLNQYVRQIVNDGRQNRPAIKVHPVDSKADLATAEVFAGTIKHIESNSGADAAYDTALDSAATGGFGYFTVTTEYSGQETFDQDICIKRVRNPLSIIIDPDSTEADGSDMKFAFVEEKMAKDVFEAKYPNKTPTDWESNSDYSDWYGEEVRVARYWEVVEEDRTLYQMADNTVISKARFDELKDAGVEIDSLVKQTRNIPVRKVMQSLVSGKEYLEEPAEWLGKYIPICVVWGNEIDVEGKVTHSGIIRPAKDAQRLYNYSRSAFAERVALTPKAPWLAAEGQVETYEDDWNTANTKSHSVLRYTPTSLNGQPVPPPQRISPSDVPVGFQQDMQISEHDIQGAVGMYAASLGAPSNERSGKAIMARQREGDTGTFHYHDNLNRAIRHCGRILVDLIPKVYDSNRIIRIMGYDGAVSEASINPTIPTASQKQGLQMMYNLGVGTYDVTITSGPSYNTLRAEATESMVTMIQAHPELMNVIGDLMVKNMDWPGAEEISKRLHMTLPPQILEAEQKASMDKMPPEMQQAIEQFDAQIQQKEEAINVAADEIERLRIENDKLKAQHDLKQQEIQIKEQEAATSRFEAETARMVAEANALNDEEATRTAAFTAANPPQTTEPAAPAESSTGIAQILKTVADMQNPEAAAMRMAHEAESEQRMLATTVHMVETNSQITQQISTAVDALVQAAQSIAQPKHKVGKATRQADGSYTMESIEQ